MKKGWFLLIGLGKIVIFNTIIYRTHAGNEMSSPLGASSSVNKKIVVPSVPSLVRLCFDFYNKLLTEKNFHSIFPTNFLKMPVNLQEQILSKVFIPFIRKKIKNVIVIVEHNEEAFKLLLKNYLMLVEPQWHTMIYYVLLFEDSSKIKSSDALHNSYKYILVQWLLEEKKFLNDFEIDYLTSCLKVLHNSSLDLNHHLSYFGNQPMKAMVRSFGIEFLQPEGWMW